MKLLAVLVEVYASWPLWVIPSGLALLRSKRWGVQRRLLLAPLLSYLTIPLTLLPGPLALPLLSSPLTLSIPATLAASLMVVGHRSQWRSRLLPLLLFLPLPVALFLDPARTFGCILLAALLFLLALLSTRSTPIPAPGLRVGMVVNPKSARSLSRARALQEALTFRGASVVAWEETTPSTPIRDTARQVCLAGVDVLVACGGDGTVRECATALEGREERLAILPLGTGNLFVEDLALPKDIEGIASLVALGHSRTVDMLRIGEDRCLVMAGMGVDARVVDSPSEEGKARWGALAYAGALLRQVNTRPLHVRVEVDDEVVEGRVSCVLVGNVGSFQGLTALPAARVDDGLLDVAIVHAHRPHHWARVLRRLVLSHAQSEEDVHLLQGRRARITARRPYPTEIDGDATGEAQSLEAEILPGCLHICWGDQVE